MPRPEDSRAGEVSAPPLLSWSWSRSDYGDDDDDDDDKDDDEPPHVASAESLSSWVPLESAYLAHQISCSETRDRAGPFGSPRSRMGSTMGSSISLVAYLCPSNFMF